MRLLAAVAFILSVFLIWFFLALSFRHVYARDLDGHYAQANPEMHKWFAQQKNQNNTSCCEIADGHHLDDADWKADDKGNYFVRINGVWRQVPDYAVINPKDRPVDYAVVWIYNDTIYCFMAGAGM